jgi:hypothetical protein
MSNLQYLSPPRKQVPRWRVLKLRFLREPGPLPACPAGEAVQQLGKLARVRRDPCRLVRQVKQFKQLQPADELLHLPDKPAGVDDKSCAC